MKYQMSGEVSFRIVVEANSEDEAMELVESDLTISDQLSHHHSVCQIP